MILITIQPDSNSKEPGETHCLYTLGFIQHDIYYKQAINVDYIMVYEQPAIIKSGAESSKWKQRGCSCFVMQNTQTMSTGTAMTSPADNVFGSMLTTTIKTKN